MKKMRWFFVLSFGFLQLVFVSLGASTVTRLADLSPGASGSYPSNFTGFSNQVLFSAYTQVTGFELWKYDGNSVSLVADINPTVDDLGFGVKEGNDSVPSWLTPFKTDLYFSAYEPTHGDEVWRYDGSQVTRVSDINPDANNTIKPLPASSWPQNLTVFSNILYFSATSRTNPENYELWSYDGANTRLAADIHPDTGTNYSSYPTGLVASANGLYFMADDGSHGWELFRYDGVSAHLIDINPGGADSSSYPKYFTPYKGELYFQAFTDAEGYELWRTDGTNATIVSDLMPGADSSYPQYMTVFNGNLYFRGTDPVNGSELQRYDGSQVTLAADINPGGDSFPKDLVVFGNSLVFTADDGVHGWELWKFDGTTASLVTDLNPSGDSFPEELTVVGNALYFTATTPDTGYEVWRYDGTNVTLAADINPGPGDSFPRLLKAIGNQLFFSVADDGNTDFEPWVITETAGTGGNVPPTVSLTVPADGATFQTTDSITISANANDDSAVAQVEFFANGVSLGVDTTAPFSITTTLSAGTYSLTATATDNAGASTTSSPVSITVNPPNQPPRVVLTAPSPGAVFKTTDAITFSADAFDDGSVAKVEFFAGANLVGTDTTAPYGVTASLAAGTYSVYARATDDLGLSAGTDPITITVQAVTSSQPTVDSITQNASSVQLQVTATDGAVLTLQASSDLVNWNPIDTATATGGKATFTESMNGPMQFYRVVSQ